MIAMNALRQSARRRAAGTLVAVAAALAAPAAQGAPPAQAAPVLQAAPVALAMSAGKATPAAPAPRAALHAEIEEAYAVVAGYQDGSVELYDAADYRPAWNRLWALVERWTAEFLQAHPAASAAAVKADLATLAGKEGWLLPSAVRLGSGRAAIVVVAIDAGFTGGDFFVVAAAQSDSTAAAWTIRPLAEKNFPLRNELGRWAFLMAGYHDGPLGGRVLALPVTRSGRPRFLIDAVTHPTMGLDSPGQVSVWEWTDGQAVPEFVEGYWTTADVGALRRRGDRIVVPTKELPKTFFSCGSCDEPEGTWTLRLTPDGVTDLGHSYKEPLFGAADDLIARLARGEDASALAAPAVVDRLNVFVHEQKAAWREEEAAHRRERAAAGREPEPAEPPGPYAGINYMLESNRVTFRGGRRIFDLTTDGWHLKLTFEKRGAVYYATRVTVF